MNDVNVFYRAWQGGIAAHSVRLPQRGRYWTNFVVAHDRFIAAVDRRDVICRTEFNSGRRFQTGYRRTVHDQNIVGGLAAAINAAWSDLIIGQIETAAVQRIAIDRIPLSIYYRIGHAGVAACERRAEIIRPGGAEIRER